MNTSPRRSRADEPDDEDRQDRGLECRGCGCRHLEAYYTRRRKDHILRVRICRNCGKRITTREKVVGDK